VERTLAAFTDYWQARAGKEACKLDWDATWRNWVRKEPQTRRVNGMPRLSRPTTDSGWIDLAARHGVKVGSKTYQQVWDEILRAADRGGT
jgi:hypothetical protein